jgi:TIR domain
MSTGPEESPGGDARDPRLYGTAGVQIGSGNVQYNYYGNRVPAGGSDTPPVPAAETADSAGRGHAFISYVREDALAVDRLQQALEAVGIPVWRDTDSLWPGQDWRAEIRNAIDRDALVFIACFSRHSNARERSYMYAELLLAIDQLRERRPGVSSLFPVRFDDCDLPYFDLGAGRTLASLGRADLFGANRDRSTGRLIAAVQKLLG